MPKTIINITLQSLPPKCEEIFKLLSVCGAKYMALFGGALRDADYSAFWKTPRVIKDYDLRVWVYNKAEEEDCIANLRKITGAVITETPSPGTGKIRYCLWYQDVELDISFRSIPSEYIGKRIAVSTVAQERAGDSDVGLSSIALDPSLKAWATSEYEYDRCNKTLTLYPNTNQNRLDEYAARMVAKFPDHHLRSFTTLENNHCFTPALSDTLTRDTSASIPGFTPLYECTP